MSFNSLPLPALVLSIRQWLKTNKKPLCIVTPNIHMTQRLLQVCEFFELNTPTYTLPDRETLPYDHFSPHQDIVSERLATLSNIGLLKQGLILSALPTLLHYLPPQNFLNAHTFSLKVGDIIETEPLSERLVHAGYYHVTKVIEHGEFSIRGSLIDLYPMGSINPFRIDRFDNVIDSIKLFDVESQRSSTSVNAMELLPAREFPLDAPHIKNFREQWGETFEGKPAQCPIYNAISASKIPAGIEYYLPLFFKNTLPTFFDFIPKNTVFLLIQDEKNHSLENLAQIFSHEIHERYERQRHDRLNPLLPPHALFLSWETFKSQYQSFENHTITLENSLPLDVIIDKKSPTPFAKLQYFLNNCPHRVLLCAQTTGRREWLQEQLSKAHLPLPIFPSWQAFQNSTSPFGITQGLVTESFQDADTQTILITETQLWGESIVQQQQKRSARTQDTKTVFRDLSELTLGAAVVHQEHGVGRYRGLQTLEYDNQLNEFLLLEYANNDKIYVPVTALEKISRYTGADSEHAPLHRLGTGEWDKEKKKALTKIQDTAAELLNIHAERARRTGFAFNPPDSDYEAFSTAFSFEETPDQIKAIEQTLNDMTTPRPMDRLICGDVGFGKTEIAMRACFLAVQNNKQVCILVPTTLLAQQHYETFCDRFSNFGVNIALLSRFRSKADTKKILEGLQQGKIDIVIGTHKLFSPQIQFERLGLLIVDEEHRFGVKQKEFLKRWRHDVDMLSLTATPIPRTLNMSLSGLRDISIISTPPLKRLAIKTFRLERDVWQIREAILREIMRGGQVFYLHNDVTSMENTIAELRKNVPEASFEIAHGQMAERQLEQVMSDFYHQRFQVLVCTTIIETGIDIPTANTIIIERADKFGLAQLHQLRGRVGRSHHQAYAYLLTPDEDAMTTDAKRRLDALLSIEDLGAGFNLASQDLEIRGAGELLGDEQSGHMQILGLSLYMDLLNQTVEALKNGEIPSFEDLEKKRSDHTEMQMHLSLVIPENYIFDVHTRLLFYKQIAQATNQEMLDDLQVELIDRFGLLPPSLHHLFKATELKLFAHSLGIKKINTYKEYAKIEINQERNTLNIDKLFTHLQTQPKTYRFDGPTQFRYYFKNTEACLEELNLLFKDLT